MKIEDKLISSFTINVQDLTEREIIDILKYSESETNIDGWNIELCHTIINGFCIGNDSGMFYLYLIQKNLENRVEIIRG